MAESVTAKRSNANARNSVKSAEQINEQTLRLMQSVAERSWAASPGQVNEDAIRRMERLRDTAQRYTNNISRFFGANDGFVSNENYGRRVSRRVYMGR